MKTDPEDMVISTRRACELLGIRSRDTLWKRCEEAGVPPYLVRGQKRGLLVRHYRELLRFGTLPVVGELSKSKAQT
jgi:hypothetical protein